MDINLSRIPYLSIKFHLSIPIEKIEDFVKHCNSKGYSTLRYWPTCKDGWRYVVFNVDQSYRTPKELGEDFIKNELTPMGFTNPKLYRLGIQYLEIV